MTKTYRNIDNEHFYHLNQVSGYRLIKIPVGETVQTTDSYNPMRQSWEIGFSDILNPYAAANSYWRLAKEQIFEDERIKINAGLPSRMKAIWLTDREHLEYWHKTLSKNILLGDDSSVGRGISILSVEATGKVFEGEAHWYELLQNPVPLFKVRDYAKRYWKSEVFRPGKMEFLLEGEMKAIEELSFDKVVRQG